ncbi:hypothetical protein BJ741DRAFT_620178 [Chytriomyces cf. hyalinus JEL632]|nr:hypothetical protein BJ741DRAFT_620178 [Chytriomyces cf. hyalinus JEL632]
MLDCGKHFLRTVLSARVRGMVKRICSKCGTRIGAESSTRQCGVWIMYDVCADRLLVDGTYVLQMTLACGNGVIEAVAFGGIVEDLVGMTAADFDRLACRHDFVHSLMELHLQSRVFYFGLSGEEKVKTKTECGAFHILRPFRLFMNCQVGP